MKNILLALLLIFIGGCKKDTDCKKETDNKIPSCESGCSGTTALFNFDTNVDSLAVEVVDADTRAYMFKGNWFPGECLFIPYVPDRMFLIYFSYMICDSSTGLNLFGESTIGLEPCKIKTIEYKHRF